MFWVLDKRDLCYDPGVAKLATIRDAVPCAGHINRNGLLGSRFFTSRCFVGDDVADITLLDDSFTVANIGGYNRLPALVKFANDRNPLGQLPSALANDGRLIAIGLQ